MRQRPVLMPGGWPIDAKERETCARAVLAAGGDLERVFDDHELGSEAYIRYVTRVPLFKLAKEHPMVFVTGEIQSAQGLLAFYTRLFELTNQFDKASWIAYLEADNLESFLCDARNWAGIDTLGHELYAWYLSPLPVLIASRAARFDRLGPTLTDLEHSPASGIVPVPTPGDAFAPEQTFRREPSQTNLPERRAYGHLSSNSLARLQLDRRAIDPVAPTRTTPPPSNPRIRRNTG